jgi:5-methylcytosine-specific restriction enzyme subunit McrC
MNRAAENTRQAETILGGVENERPDEDILKIIEEEKFQSRPESKGIAGIKAFGLNRDLNGNWWFGYYTGVDYLDDNNNHPVIISPKIADLDYWKMFRKCAETPGALRHMADMYHVRLEKPFIKIPGERSNFLTPLIMYHYMFLLSKLVKRPLVKSYVNRIENLKSKVKGKILLGAHIKKNIACKRYDRVMCSFDEYSADCPANRLLHSAYKICMQYAENHKKLLTFLSYNYIESYFQNIGYIDSLFELSKTKINSLFFEYKDALRIAKIIFKLKSYNEGGKNKTSFEKIPPYIIDMSKLFELYVLALMETAKFNVRYQEGGNYGDADFLEYNAKIIIDTKYKTVYDKENQKYEIEDIRQMAGYARDNRLLKKLYGDKDNSWKTTVPKCLIIYPIEPAAKGGPDSMPSNPGDLTGMPIEQFNEFYKFGIRLPGAK